MRARVAAGLLAAAFVLSATACREGAQPFTLPETGQDTASLRQLTFSTGDERDPQWSADGDSIYYHARNWYDAPGPGTLLRIGVEGGVAAPLADYAQPNPALFLTNPAVPRNGARLAYLHFARIRPESNCHPADGQDPPGHICFPTQSPEPVLDSTVLRVRLATATSTALQDPGVAIRHVGLDPLQWSGGDPPYRQRVYPFHVDWKAGESTDLRPAWSPDGNRIVFSDGVGLHTWTPPAPGTAAIPNTADGVSPAWSPDGNWIAFTVIARGDSVVADCLCAPMSRVHHLRTWWHITGYRLVVIRPDGTGRRELGEGREPAWSPDSKTLYVRRGDGIYRVPLDQPGAAQLVPRTAGGLMPAVSPDGRLLAFVRREPLAGDLDIWLTSLEN